MSTPTPPPTAPQPPAVLISTVRTITPVVVSALIYALAKANVHLTDNAALETGADAVLATVAGTAWTAGGRWLETHKSTWWGKLFILAKAPAYAAVGAAAPVVATETVEYLGAHEAPPPKA